LKYRRIIHARDPRRRAQSPSENETQKTKPDNWQAAIMSSIKKAVKHESNKGRSNKTTSLNNQPEEKSGYDPRGKSYEERVRDAKNHLTSVGLDSS
jgi:hypothetical protein